MTEFNELQSAVKVASLRRRVKIASLRGQVKAALGVEPIQDALGVSTNQAPAPPKPVQSPVAPAATGAEQPVPVPSSAGTGPAPNASPSLPANAPPAAAGMGSAPPASPEAQIDAQVQQAEQVAQEAEAQAKVQGAQIKILNSQNKVMENEHKLQEAKIKAQQLRAGVAPQAAVGERQISPAVQSKAAELQAMIKSSGRRPLSTKEASVKVKLHAAKRMKYAALRNDMADSSALAEALLRDISENTIKQGFEREEGILEMDPRLVAFGLQSKGCGKLIDMVHQRQMGRARVEKVAAGDLEAYRDVLRRGHALHNSIVKMAKSIFTVMEDIAEESGDTPDVFLTKAAAGVISPRTLTVKQAVSLIADRKYREKMKFADDAKTDLNKSIDEYEPANFNPSKLRELMVDHPEFRKAANIAIFNHAGAAALVNNDTETAARCILGLAIESAMGHDARKIALT